MVSGARAHAALFGGMEELGWGRWRRFEFTGACVRMASLRAGWSPEMVSTVAPVVTALVTGDDGGTVANLRVTVDGDDGGSRCRRR